MSCSFTTALFIFERKGLITIAQLKDLIVSGTARIIGKLYSSEFVGKLTGNADTATKATQDSAGQQINTTYIKGLSVSGKTVTYTKGDGTTGTITTQDTNTTYSAGTGISLSGTTFSNSGVRSISTGETNGTISVNTNGTSAEVAVKGLGSAAYTASSDYASSSHTHTKSQITDFPSSLPASDVYSWAKASSKPSYSWSEITDKPSSFTPASHTHNYAGSSSAGGSATSAVKLDSSAGSATQPIYFSDGKPVACGSSLGVSITGNAATVTGTLTNPTDFTTYYIPFHSEASTDNKSLLNNNGIKYVTQKGTTSTDGRSLLVLGNSTASGSDGNKYGNIRLYGKSSGYTSLDTANTSTSSYTITLPAKTGTVALTSDIPNGVPSGGSSGQILGYSADGTAVWTNSVSDLVVSGSLSMGRKADTTVGDNSFAFGYSSTASGSHSFAGGYSSTASGAQSFAFGKNAKAEGDYSIALGYHTTAKATLPDSSATAIGYYTTANKYQFACGKYNSSATGGSVTSTSSGTAFVIGNGTASSNSNACRITYAGAVIGKAAYQSTGADFAELREWSDGNPNNEDRRGYFVTMDGMNIRIASPGDYICGIISANPSVIGNNDEDWMGRYVFDDFGAFVYEDYEETDPETGEVRTFTHYKENPEYDPTREYKFRADRPEWDYVGLCGVIHVRDDGTCQVNGFCKCAAGGIATASERGYRVLERVNDHIVKVLFYLTGETF